MTEPFAASPVLTPLIASPTMRATVDDRSRLQRMLDFESMLARAQAAAGVIPVNAIDAISTACKAERYDLESLNEQAITAGNFATPMITALTAQVARADAEAARYVHWGASSQDVIDSALVLELRAAIDALTADLDRAIEGFTALAGRHRRTPTAARTLLQYTLPMPFGLKLAGYAAALGRSRARLQRLRREALFLQFGGAAGTLAAFGDRGFEVADRLAALLNLPMPDAPWHSHSDRLAEVAAALAILAGTCGKIAGDVALLMQTDVAEAFEPAAPANGDSSNLPHKRNPVIATVAMTAATMAPNLAATIFAAQVQEHERALGGWQAQWLTFPALSLVTSGATAAIVTISEGLDVDAERMRANLDSTRGLYMADAIAFTLASKIGRAEAGKLIAEASQKALADKRHLEEVLREDERIMAHLSTGDLGRLFEPMAYQGVAQTFIERLIASTKMRGHGRS